MLSHYARYAAGKTRVSVTSNLEGIQATAYTDGHGNISLVVMNTTSEFQTVTVKGVKASTTSAVFTNAAASWQATTAKKTDEGIQLLLPSMSITSVALAQ
ncbi:MAG: hypothetical protein IJV44_11370 [Prevotella sp.]|nr:hypothetical protein [Prevotella sp.]